MEERAALLRQGPQSRPSARCSGSGDMGLRSPMPTVRVEWETEHFDLLLRIDSETSAESSGHS